MAKVEGGCLRQEQAFVLELTFPPFPECGLSATQAGSLDTLNGALCSRGTAEGSLRESVCEHALSTDPHLETAPCLALEINTAVAKEADVSAPVARSWPGRALPTCGSLRGTCCPFGPGF